MGWKPLYLRFSMPMTLIANKAIQVDNEVECNHMHSSTFCLTKIWHLVIASRVLVCNSPKYVKLAKMAIVQVVGNVKDGCCFYTLAFMKSKLRNWLITHLPLVVWMFAQRFYILQNIPYAKCIGQGQVAKQRYCYDG